LLTVKYKFATRETKLSFDWIVLQAQVYIWVCHFQFPSTSNLIFRTSNSHWECLISAVTTSTIKKMLQLRVRYTRAVILNGVIEAAPLSATQHKRGDLNFQSCAGQKQKKTAVIAVARRRQKQHFCTAAGQWGVVWQRIFSCQSLELRRRQGGDPQLPFSRSPIKRERDDGASECGYNQ
jgi:hypothetical protein